MLISSPIPQVLNKGLVKRVGKEVRIDVSHTACRASVEHRCGRRIETQLGLSQGIFRIQQSSDDEDMRQMGQALLGWKERQTRNSI